MDEFKNRTYEGIHYSRFIASWIKVGGNPRSIIPWLQNLNINGKDIPEEVILEIYKLATNGKLELETDATLYLKRQKS